MTEIAETQGKLDVFNSGTYFMELILRNVHHTGLLSDLADLTPR